MNKEYTLTLGGKERALLFGKTGFYKYIHEVTKSDPLEWFGKFGESDKVSIIDNMKDAAIIVYAGLNTYADNNDQPNVPFEKVEKWVNGLDVQVLTAVVPFAFNAFSVEEKKEPAPQENP